MKYYIIAILMMMLFILLYSENDEVSHYSYSYDATAGLYTETIDGISYLHDTPEPSFDFHLDNLKFQELEWTNSGWTIKCYDIGTNCINAIIEADELWKQMNE